MTTKPVNKPEDSITFSNKNVVNVFTDIIQINVSNETVSLELAIRNKDNKTADITHNVIMTLPHFMRFMQVGNKISTDIREQLQAKKK